MPDTSSVKLPLPRPGSTYRLQFHAKFTFQDAAKITAYLADLGITHAYASPYLKARPGSTHGYDVIDHSTLNPELGTMQDYQAWLDELQQQGMSHILDTVPNHVGIATNDNAWWNDVLEHGPASKYANYFDINWRSPNRESLRDKVLLPVLGEPFSQALEQGKLQAIVREGKLALQYYDRYFPIAPETYERKLSPAELEKTAAKLNGKPGDSASFQGLDDLLNRQHYRLAHWRLAPEEINYRRFFDINDLAALRMENPEVFRATHRFTLKLLAEGKIAGLRIDHPDGLYDPAEYLHRLQQAYIDACKLPAAKANDKPLYVTVEKILAVDESLPLDWPVDGTTGYDYLNQINGWFIDAHNRTDFNEIYKQYTGETASFPDVAIQKKLLILDRSFSSELHTLARQLDDLAQKNRALREFTLTMLREALRQVIACFPVYRSYIAQGKVSPTHRRYIQTAIAEVQRRNPLMATEILQFLQETLLLKYPPTFSESDREAQQRFVGKFQQLTAPVIAKGIEDTAFYCYHRFISLNEVGGDPDRFGVESETLHKYLQDRQTHWPYALSALSTHDTKRSEDVRARLNALSEIPGRWQQRIERWRELNGRRKQIFDGRAVPDSNEEYLLYQTIVGAWPPGMDSPTTEFIQRITDYLLKALRESKVHTNWTDPNEAYEKAATQFAREILDPQKSQSFLNDFIVFTKWLIPHGLRNSFAQTLLRLTAPGVPDTYQGCELWDFSLVDPDNRRPVDYTQRRRLLSELDSTLKQGGDRTRWISDTSKNLNDGRLKLFLTSLLLRYRRDHPQLFSRGSYEPLKVTGAKANHVLAFRRTHESESAIMIVPRFGASWPNGSAPLGFARQIWQDTAIELSQSTSRALTDHLTGAPCKISADARIALADLPDHLPGWFLI
jgi:(1->4)-alpha-D-glucan 1-alpha-D-glucosylmutase